ncbi:restriction endonuclease subunit S, partial [Chryseobacterium sp. Leaf201]|uniref:restriction endonuclease subunit S n=1 Tax=Chryseobacterium sp. Leaf201 TaxID=1735672 RepID=UPI001EE70892
MSKVKLGDILKTSSGATPLTTKKEYYENGDIPWINSGEVGQYKINKAEKFISKLGFDNSNAKLFPKNSVLVAMYGATAGKTSILNIEAATNQAICALLPNERIDQYFLKYWLDTLYIYLVQISSGSARDNLSQKVIQDIEIKLPDISSQKKIASTLSTLDDKIELNNEINDNLERMAKTLYDYWFVQFDFPNENGKPYKSSGGKMIWNDVLKREIP